MRANQNAMKMATKKVTKSQASSKNVIENKACKAEVLKSYNERAGDRLAHHSDGSHKPLVPPHNSPTPVKKGLQVTVTDETVSYSNVITTLQTTTDTGEEEEENLIENQGQQILSVAFQILTISFDDGWKIDFIFGVDILELLRNCHVTLHYTPLHTQIDMDR